MERKLLGPIKSSGTMQDSNTSSSDRSDNVSGGVDRLTCLKNAGTSCDTSSSQA